MAQLYAGTSGWAYPSWKPDFYPAKLAQTKFLQYYATQLNAVEVNFTFRQLLKDTTAQKWIEDTPAGFRLGVKAHQVITHIKRLEKNGRLYSAVLEHHRAVGAGGKAGTGAISIAAEYESRRYAAGRIFERLPRAFPSAFEFRHASWFTEEIFDLLKRENRALCVAETEERATPDVVTSDFATTAFVSRLILRKNARHG